MNTRAKYGDVILKLVDKRELQRVFTHYSYFGTDKSKGNGKYVYAGRHIFRGHLASSMLNKIIRPVGEIEQGLTKLYSVRELSKIFDLYQLGRFARAGEKYEIEQNKDTFALAFLGLAALHADEHLMDQFVYTHFIDDSLHLFPKPTLPVIEAVNQYFLEKRGERIRVSTRKTEDFYETVLTVGETELMRATSKSYKYAKKKAYKELYRCIDKAD